MPSDASAPPLDPSAALFLPTTAFSGRRAGYVFKKDKLGIGYYRDTPEAAAEIAARAQRALEEASRWEMNVEAFFFFV